MESFLVIMDLFYCFTQSEILKLRVVFFIFFPISGMTQEDLFKIWSEEAEAALGAKKKGIVLDLWKVVAQRKVRSLLNTVPYC